MSRLLEALKALGGHVDNAPAVRAIQKDFHIHVIVKGDRRDRVIQAAAIVNLLSRIFQRISLEGAQPSQLLSPRSLRERIATGEQHRARADLIIVASPDSLDVPEKRHFYVDNRGWMAYLSTREPCTIAPGDENPLSALYAGGLAVNEAFNIAFRGNINGVALLDGTLQYDILRGAQVSAPSYEPNLASLIDNDLDVLLVGAGAVGQAMVYALGMLPALRGRFHAVDHETIDANNFERYVLASQETLKAAKAEHAIRHLAERFPLLDVHANTPTPPAARWVVMEPPENVNLAFGTRGPSAASPGSTVPVGLVGMTTPKTTYQQFRSHDGASPRRLVVCAVDSAKARRDVQFGMHKVILNGWTETEDSMQTYGVGRHEIGEKACMACMYHKKEAAAPDPIEFDRRLTGLPDARLRELREDRTKVPTRAELEAIAKHRNMPFANLAPVEGRGLAVVLQQLCGVATVQDQDRLGTSPVGHVGFLVGVHLAAFTLLESAGWPAGQPEILQGDARTLPRGGYAVPEREPREGCLCTDERVRSYYAKLWQ